MEINYFNSLRKIVLVVFCVFFISACSNSMHTSRNSKENSSFPSTDAATRQSSALYYDFDDVLVPKEMTVINDSTVVVSTPGYTSGILTLKGRIEVNSLFNFFNNNMQKDNWNIVSQIKSPASIIMIFHKTSRWAMITLREKEFYTYAEIGVAPALADAVPGSDMERETTLFE